LAEVIPRVKDTDGGRMQGKCVIEGTKKRQHRWRTDEGHMAVKGAAVRMNEKERKKRNVAKQTISPWWYRHHI